MNDNELKTMTLAAIRVKCAELVGWHKHDCGDPLCWKLGTGIMGITRSIHDLPSFTESADAALQLVEWMSKPENGAYFWSADYFTNSPKYTAAFISQKKAFQMTADTFALAVCLAFLKANNIEPETL